jgi:hypothetical protein
VRVAQVKRFFILHNDVDYANKPVSPNWPADYANKPDHANKPAWAVGALFSGARCIHITHVN